MVCVEMRARGLLTKPTQGKSIRFAPPLMISHAQMDEAVSIIASSYRAVDQKL
jgi:ornithine--oxo-acid transaminase